MGTSDGRVGRAVSDGYGIHYEAHGRGRPIVLVHGWGANVETAWKRAGLGAADPDTLDDEIARLYRAYVDLDPRNDREALALAAAQMWPQGFPRELGGPGLQSATAPVLVINGADDVRYVRSQAALVDAIPGAALVEIPDADHLAPVFDERFKDEVVDFLRRIDG